MFRRIAPLAVLLLAAACTDTETPHDDAPDHDHGLITRLALTFTPEGGGDDLVFEWEDHDGEVHVDDIVLTDGVAYQLALGFWNDETDPPDDVSLEVEDEGTTHQVFLTGTAVEGPATGDNADAIVAHAYADEDDEGLPLGLLNDIEAIATGTGTFEVTLRHLPEESGEATKVADLAAQVADGGFGSIGGESDVSVSFDLAVE